MATRDAIAPGVVRHYAEYEADIAEEDEYMASYPPYDLGNATLTDEVTRDTWTSLSIGPSLTPDQKHESIKLLQSFRSCFPTSKVPIEKCNAFSHHIDTGNHRPAQQALRRSGFAPREEITKQIRIMLASDVIAPCVEIEWSSNLHLVVEKHGTFRMCVDFRDLNNITMKDLYPMVRIDDCLDSLKQTSMYTSLDLVSGYWQIQCEVFQGLKMKICLVYLDDIQVYANGFPQHRHRLAHVLQRLQAANLKIKPSKCFFCQDRLLFLGHMVSSKGLEPDPGKIGAIKLMEPPDTITQVRSFLGDCTHFRRFILKFSRLATPLQLLTHKDDDFSWDQTQQLTFESLKESLAQAPILGHFDYEAHHIVEIDASIDGLGVILFQEEGESKVQTVIAYASRTLTKAEKNYSVYELELLAVVWSVHKWPCYLKGPHGFDIITDYKALCGLLKSKDPRGRLARWVLLLRPFNCQIRYRPGAQNRVADCLSRLPLPLNSETKRDITEHTAETFCGLTLLNFSIEEYRAKDRFCAAIISDLNGTTITKTFRDRTRAYAVKNQLLYKLAYRDNRVWLLLVMPSALRTVLLKLAHDEISASQEPTLICTKNIFGRAA